MPHRSLPWIPVLLLVAGCAASVPAAPPVKSLSQLPPVRPVAPVDGGRYLKAVAEATDRVAATLERHLVYVEVTVEAGAGSGGAHGGGRRGGPQQPQGPQQMGMTGVVLQADGLVLIPVPLPKGRVQDLKIWAGGKEYAAEVQKIDERLQMTLLKVQVPGSAFVPVPAAERAFPRRGEWLVSLVCGGKDVDFQVFPGLGMVRGKVSGLFDQIVMDGGSVGMGTVLADLDGRIVGITRVAQNGMMMVPQALFFPEVIQKLELGKKAVEVAEAAAEPEDDEEDTSLPGKGKPWLGITMDPINEAYAEASNLPKEGIWVRDVFGGSPAAKGGLKPSDLLVGVNQHPFTRSGPRALEQLGKFTNPKVGTEVTFDVLRDGKPLTLTCCYEKAPEMADLQADDLGIQVRELTESLFCMTPGVYQREGVLVTSVVNGSAASRQMGPGDVIVELDRKPVRDLKAFTAALEDLRRRKAEVVLVKVCRGNRTAYVALDLTLRLHGKGDKS